MDKKEAARKKRLRQISVVFIADIIFCLIILALITISFISAYDRPTLISRTLVKVISLLSSFIGFLVVTFLLVKMEYFGSSLSKAILFLYISSIGGIIHLILALALIFFQTTTWGLLPVMSGYIYREYGYAHLINAICYIIMFVYFIRCLRPSISKK
jgi:hypothetical protein